MEDKSRGWLFRKRNILGAALVSGIIVGLYLPDFWKGFGGGSIVGVGVGDPATGTDGKTASDNETTDDSKTKPDEPKGTPLVNVPPVIKVVIDERSYFIRSPEGDRAVELVEVIDLVKAAAGDADGIRVRVYRKGSSRPSAENALQDAFTAAGISDAAIVWIPTVID